MQRRLLWCVCGATMLAVAGCGGAKTAGQGILFLRLHRDVQRVYLWRPGTHASPVGPVRWIDDAQWSPDGQFIAFSGQAGEWDQANPEDIYVMRADGHDVERLTRSTGPGNSAGEPSWSPAGTQIVFARGTVNARYPQLVVVSSAGGSARTLAAAGFFPVWGRAGIAYVSRRDPSTVTLLSPAMGLSRVLFTTYDGIDGLAWSRRGRLAALEGDYGRQRIVVYTSEGREVDRLSLGRSVGNVCAFTWSPDGSRLLVLGRSEGTGNRIRAWTLTLDGGHRRRLPFRSSGSCAASWR